MRTWKRKGSRSDTEGRRTNPPFLVRQSVLTQTLR